MSSLPSLKTREAKAILRKLGFAEVRMRESHKQFRYPDGRGITVPFHVGRGISPIVLRKIASDLDMSVEDFIVVR